MGVTKLDYRCQGNYCLEATKCRRYLGYGRDKINCNIPFAAFDQRDTVICDGFLPRIAWSSSTTTTSTARRHGRRER